MLAPPLRGALGPLTGRPSPGTGSVGAAGAATQRDNTAVQSDGVNLRERPYVVLSCAMSLDGYLDDATDERLVLSNSEDLDRVDAMRAGCDAILVGANTIRRDNPRLMVRAQERREERAGNGLPPLPIKVPIFGHGAVAPQPRFSTEGDPEKMVSGASPPARPPRSGMGGGAGVVDGGEPVDLAAALADLAGRGVR